MTLPETSLCSTSAKGKTVGGSLSDVKGISQLVDHGPSVGLFDIVLIAEGYTQGGQQKWFDDAQEFATTLFDHAPFSAIDCELATNIWRIDVVSAESGMDDPSDCGGATGTGAMPNTVFDASRCDDGVQRGITLNTSLVHDVADFCVPSWNVVLVIINSDLRAGESHGNIGALTTYSGDLPWVGVALHELGHAGFDLADEYESLKGCDPSGPFSDGPDQYHFTEADPGNVNVSKISDLSTIKWKELVTTPPTVVPNPDCSKCNPATSTVPPTTVGAFEGAYQYRCGIFRPVFDCRMRHENRSWCPVCRGHIQGTLLVFTTFQTWPADDGTSGDVDPWSPMLAWTPGDWESVWQLQITDQPTFSMATPVTAKKTQELNGVHVAYADADELPTLKPDTQYQWRVRKVSDTDIGAWTKPRKFRTAAKKVTLKYPLTVQQPGGRRRREGPGVYPWRLEFGWEKVDGADHYEIEVMDSAGPIFPSTVVTEPGELTTTLDVKVHATLHWSARAIPPEGDTYAGAWSDPFLLITSKPAVTIEKPPDNSSPYPWPVQLEWKKVKGAGRYRVDIQRKKSQWGADSVQKNLWELSPSVTHVELNLVPQPSSDNEIHTWRVRVWGPPPLEEEGTDSGWYTFLNDGEQTAPGVYVLFDSDPQTVGWGGWAVHTDGDVIYWDHSMKWGGVDGATKYNVTLQPWGTKSGPPGGDAVSVPVEATDDDDQVSQDYQLSIRTDKETLNPPPGVGVEGYSWDAYATGPEELTGLSATEAFGNIGPDMIEPDPPILIEPASGAAGVDPADLAFSFTSQYTPSGDYMVHLEGLMPGGQVDVQISGNPGDKTSFDLSTLGLSASDLMPEKVYQWRVRAIANDPDITDIYAWGPTWSFTTAPASPPILAFDEPNCSKLPQIFDREPLIPGATQYDFQYEQIPVGINPQDLDSVPALSEQMGVTWMQDDLGPQTATYESLTGVALPAGEVALPLPGTVCDQANYAYRCRYRICKGGANCSKFTDWFHFWEDTS